MDCQKAKSLLAALSADDLTANDVSTLEAHFALCPECEHEWFVFQNTLFVVSTAPQPLPTPGQSQVMWQACSQQIHLRIEERRLASRRPGLFSWAARQPRLGWVALGGAFAVLGGVWLFGPSEAPSTSASLSMASLETLNSSGADDLGPLIAMSRPPRNAASLVNHHAAMAFDPFTDHVGSSLISYAATSPSGGQPGASGR